MSIALWKTVLGLAKAFAVLVILGAGFLLWSHTKAMAKGWNSPDFSPPAKTNPSIVGQTGNLSLALGRFQRERPKTEDAPKKEEVVDIANEIAKHGEITDAIVVYEPYEEGGIAPALIFRLKTNEVRTIRLGEAIIEKPNPKFSQHPIAVKFKFVGCKRDPANPAVTLFRFDVNCDGKDIQEARWKFDEPAKETAKPVEEGPTGPVPVITDKMYVGDPMSARKAEEPPPQQPEQVQAVPVPPVVPAPAPEPLTVEQEDAGTLFDDEEGTFAPTPDGVAYLERNYEKILEETRTAPYRDRDGRTGIRVVGISNQSVANQFGIRKDDIIIKINGIPVGSQSEAVNAVKGELKKKPAVNIIRVTIRRRGAEKELKFDTRDPATRRAAKKAFK
jgi:hypothetical protein